MPSPRIGLALGGGAALGAAHVGVLRALADHGIEPAVVTGTSAGALIGAALAADLPVDVIEEQVRAANWATFGKLTLTPRLGLLDSSVLAASVALLGPRPRIEDLPRRFGAVATDVRTRTPVVLASGPLDLALRASIAVPGIFSPIPWNGRYLVDGGLVENLPIEPARELGADLVIAVRLGRDGNRPSRAKTLSATVTTPEQARILMIEPRLRQLSRWSPRDVPRIIDAGRRAAEVTLSGCRWSWAPAHVERAPQQEAAHPRHGPRVAGRGLGSAPGSNAS